ncbi:MAG: ABC transporter ATP-binding protein [Flavobacteriales bacterium]|jgi:ABC-type multidrug transport system ATPase subunit|nr:ABC transporter ATP-binding protein [Flavobacteriales bacterium]
MEVTLAALSKTFGREAVIREASFSLSSGSRTVILGPNGSGKSTLLQLVAGALMPSSGTITHAVDAKAIAADRVYRHVSIAAPYLGLYEDLSLSECIRFHARFKPFRPGIGEDGVARMAYLDHALEKPVRHFSSGMKQRLKLALAILSNTPLLLLDEPASNLDAEAISWFRALLREHAGGRTLVVASNRQPAEHDLCDRALELRDGVPVAV